MNPPCWGSETAASLNLTIPEEVLDAFLWVSTQEVQQLSDAWLVTYNEHRPHDALGRVTPLTYLARVTTSQRAQSPTMRSPLDGEAFRCVQGGRHSTFPRGWADPEAAAKNDVTRQSVLR